jgi:hypothetical protein
VGSRTARLKIVRFNFEPLVCGGSCTQISGSACQPMKVRPATCFEIERRRCRWLLWYWLYLEGVVEWIADSVAVVDEKRTVPCGLQSRYVLVLRLSGRILTMVWCS